MSDHVQDASGRAMVVAVSALAVLATVLPAATAAADGITVAGLAEFGRPSAVVVVSRPGGATAAQWELCAPTGECQPVDDGGDPWIQAVGDAPAGSTWRVTAQDAGATISGSSPAWAGPLHVLSPPGIRTAPRPGRLLDIVRGVWSGGFADTRIRRIVASCSGRPGTDCVALSDTRYGSVARATDRDTRRYLRVVELPECGSCPATADGRLPYYPLDALLVAAGSNVSSWAWVAPAARRTDRAPRIQIGSVVRPGAKIRIARVSEPLTLQLNASRRHLRITCAVDCVALKSRLEPFRGKRVSMVFRDARGFTVLRATRRLLG